jgi:peptide-methionine (S)-S-oxide reductase
VSKGIVFGGGCFWCLDAAYRIVRGIESSIAGYAGGSAADPTYEQVLSGDTGHAEVVRLEYDESQISLEDILRIFWVIHDPTTLNRQGYDIGAQYRSCIFYEDEEDLETINRSLDEIQKLWNDPVVTQVTELAAFYPADDYHQDYFAKNPEAGYCQSVINPKLLKLRQSAAELLAA